MPYYLDNFDGANDTNALKARGYAIYYRGTGPQGANAIWYQGNPDDAGFPSLNGPPDGYVGSDFNSVTDLNTIDNWLVLPANNVQSNDYLFFFSRSPDASEYVDSIRVMYSAAGDSVPEAGSWVQLDSFKVSTTGWEQRGFRAPSSGSSARFAIRYTVADGGPGSMTNSDHIGIDSLTIERPGVANDVSVLENLSPIGTIQLNSATIAPKATIFNFGSDDQSNFDVTCTISSGGYSSTKTVTSLTSGSSTTVIFDSTFSPTSEGTFELTIRTDLSSDENRTNDTLKTQFTVVEQNWGGGGGNSGGYYFANSLSVGAPSRPAYDWIDPVANGHTVATFSNTDDGVKSVDLGFDFTYFGTPFSAGTTNLNIFTNGFLTLGTPGSAFFFGATAIPDVSNPPNLIAGCFIDMDLDPVSYPSAKIYYGGDPNKFVVTYFHVYRFVSGGSSTDYITFQVIFFPNGNIKFQYNDSESLIPATSFLNLADIGIQNAAGNLGLQYRVDGVGGPIFGSPLALMFGPDQSVLPVQLSSFTAHVQQGAIRLDWTTLSEVNNYGFYVERRSASQQDFETAPNSFIPGHGTTLQRHDYSFVDNTLSTPGEYDYRLRQIDLDGSVHRTEPITVNFSVTSVSEEAPRRFALDQNYPNPFNPSTEIRFTVEMTGPAILEVHNILGEKVATLFDGIAEAGRYYKISLNGANLASGVYFYSLKSGRRNDLKKMLLLR